MYKVLKQSDCTYLKPCKYTYYSPTMNGSAFTHRYHELERQSISGFQGLFALILSQIEPLKVMPIMISNRIPSVQTLEVQLFSLSPC